MRATCIGCWSASDPTSDRHSSWPVTRQESKTPGYDVNVPIADERFGVYLNALEKSKERRR